jgi:hypothetical protein
MIPTINDWPEDDRHDYDRYMLEQLQLAWERDEALRVARDLANLEWDRELAEIEQAEQVEREQLAEDERRGDR